jgi:membrane protein DedA with SNARE-associated domain
MNEVTQFLTSHGGPVLFAVVFAEQAGLPLPAAPWLLAAGALSASGKVNALLAITMTALASVIADWIWFRLGRRGGQRVLRPFCRLSLSPNSCVGRTKGLFARHGQHGLLAAKFIPVLGTVMPPLAGALGMSTGRFLFFDGLGALFYGAFYVLGGFFFHNQLQKALAMLNQIGFSAFVAASILVLGYIAFKYARRRRPLILRSQQRNARSQGAGVADEDIVVTHDGTRESKMPILGEHLSPAAFQNVALALTKAAPHPGRAPASPVRPALCEL